MGNAHREHLSPSASSRWMNCPFSTVYENSFNMINDKTTYRNEARIRGDNAHEKAAKLLRAKLEGGQKNETEFFENDQDISAYVDYVFGRYISLRENYPNTSIQIETMVDSSNYAVNCYGTADVFIVGGHDLIVIDLKTGSEEIQAIKNSQLMIYALGVFDIYGKIYNEISNVELVIFQPRCGGVKKWNTSLSALLEWGNKVLRPAASDALNPEYRSLKCGTWCQYCKGADYCIKNFQQFYEYEELYGELTKENLMRIRSLIDEANNIKYQIESLKLDGFPSLHEIPKTFDYIRSLVDQLQGVIDQNNVLHGKAPRRTRSLRKSAQHHRKLFSIDPETGEHMDLTSIDKFKQEYNKACRANKAHPMIISDKDGSICILVSLYWWEKDMQRQISDCEEYLVNRSTFWSSRSGKTYYLVDGNILSDYELYVRHVRGLLNEYDLLLEYITRIIDVIDHIAESNHDRENAPVNTTISHDRETSVSALKRLIKKHKKQEG